MASIPVRHGRAILRGTGHDPDDYAPQPDSYPVEMYYSYEQAAMLCQCSEGTVKQLVHRHNMKRYLVRTTRRRRGARIMLPSSTVRRLRIMILGLP